MDREGLASLARMDDVALSALAQSDEGFDAPDTESTSSDVVDERSVRAHGRHAFHTSATLMERLCAGQHATRATSWMARA